MRTGLWRSKRYRLLGALILFLIFIGWGVQKLPIPQWSEVKNNFTPSDLWIVDKNNYPLESIRRDSKQRSLAWMKIEEVSPIFLQLLLQAEDKRFYSHNGVDVMALLSAGWSSVKNESLRGASTLTMQLVSLLEGNALYQRRNLWQKAWQMMTALKLEWYWSKKEILEAYINLVPFRGELVGLSVASQGYFSKAPEGLIEEESALLVALIRSPNAAFSRVVQRACGILKRDSCVSLQSLAQEKMSSGYHLSRTRSVVPILASQFVVNSENQKQKIQTTLDRQIQTLAMQLSQEQIRQLQNQNMKDVAILVLETKTGKAVGYVGNAGSGYASASYIDGVQMRRQAGSTIKPFVYATAFEWQFLKQDSLLEDSPADISIGQGRVYQPRNYDHSFHGLVSVGEALGSSLNVPSVRVIQLVGEKRVWQKLKDLGFQNLQDEDFYGPSLALGAVDVSLWDLTQGYRKLAQASEFFSQETRESIFNILASRENRRFTFGTDSLLSLPFAAAVKTGTSKDMRDNWCIGWTSEYTVGVWVGNFDGSPMWNVSGISGAAPIWRNLMLALHPTPPSIQPNVTYYPPAEALQKSYISRIKYPADGMLVGLDPDIPKDLQKIPIEIENLQSDHQVFIEKKPIHFSKNEIFWPVKKGRFLVQLKNADGTLVDQVHFEVR